MNNGESEDMKATLRIDLTLSDDFSRFDLFGPAWVVVKIGQRDDDYEPGYIAVRHSASLTMEFDAHNAGLFNAAKQLAEVATQAVTDCLCADKNAQGEVSIAYEIEPPSPMSLVIFPESLTALASIGLPLVIRPHLDCWIETRASDGAKVAKYERVI